MKTRIKEYRARYDLTQAQLADMVGVRGRLLSSWRKYNPSLKLAHDIAVVLKRKSMIFSYLKMIVKNYSMGEKN